jgi:hypothetical protein
LYFISQVLYLAFIKLHEVDWIKEFGTSSPLSDHMGAGSCAADGGRYEGDGGGVSAVLNPGRAGVHYRVIQDLRRLPLLDTLVYVSCQPEDSQVYYNMMDLMAQDKKETPAKLESKPFSDPGRYVSPHTPLRACFCLQALEILGLDRVYFQMF